MTTPTGYYKEWYKSKTLWVNIIAIAALVVESIAGAEMITGQEQVAILAVINMVLRFITNQGLTK